MTASVTRSPLSLLQHSSTNAQVRRAAADGDIPNLKPNRGRFILGDLAACTPEVRSLRVTRKGSAAMRTCCGKGFVNRRQQRRCVLPGARGRLQRTFKTCGWHKHVCYYILLSFSKLVENVESDAVAKVLYKHKLLMVGHIVVIGPGGVQLCSCLQSMRIGLQCRHVFAALITEMKRGAEFLGGSVNPRWRIRSEKWSLASAGLRKFNGEGCGEGEGYGEFSGRTRGFAARHRSQRCRVYSSWKNVCELDGNKLKVRPEVRRQIRPEQFVA